MLTFLSCSQTEREKKKEMKFSGFWTRFWGDEMRICIITKLLPFFMEQLFTLSVRSACSLVSLCFSLHSPLKWIIIANFHLLDNKIVEDYCSWIVQIFISIIIRSFMIRALFLSRLKSGCWGKFKSQALRWNHFRSCTFCFFTWNGCKSTTYGAFE